MAGAQAPYGRQLGASTVGCRLPQFAVATWNGLVWINLDADAGQSRRIGLADDGEDSPAIGSGEMVPGRVVVAWWRELLGGGGKWS